MDVIVHITHLPKILVLSANLNTLPEILSSKSLIKIKNNKGPKTEPWELHFIPKRLFSLYTNSLSSVTQPISNSSQQLPPMPCFLNFPLACDAELYQRPWPSLDHINTLHKALHMHADQKQ